MNLPNTHFQDFPIEFKEINPEDFPHFEVEDKVIISPDNQGWTYYIRLDIKLRDLELRQLTLNYEKTKQELQFVI